MSRWRPHEGGSLLNAQIRTELARIDAAKLTEHGFEILLKKVAS